MAFAQARSRGVRWALAAARLGPGGTARTPQAPELPRWRRAVGKLNHVAEESQKQRRGIAGRTMTMREWGQDDRMCVRTGLTHSFAYKRKALATVRQHRTHLSGS